MTLFERTIVFLATGFGSGYSPKAPGTFGTLVALPFVYWIQKATEDDLTSKLGTLALSLVLGFFITKKAEDVLGLHDDSRIVIDEFAGMLVTLLFFAPTWAHLITGFLLFRLYDIWKPGLIGTIDAHGPGAWGTFFDDVVAGLAAALSLYTLNYFNLLPH